MAASHPAGRISNRHRSTEKMNNLARRARLLAIVPVLAGAALMSLTAPAIAAPAPTPGPAPAEESRNCSTPVDGVTLCLLWNKNSDPAKTTLRASLSIEEGRTVAGALVALEACSGKETCPVVETATGQGKREVVTKDHAYGRGVGYYRVNASWVDDKQQHHTGVAHPDY
jgi:hypothetical protein